MRKSTISVLGGLAVVLAVSGCSASANAGDGDEYGCINNVSGEIVDSYYCDHNTPNLVWYYPPRADHIIFVPGQRVTVINTSYYNRPSNVTLIKHSSGYKSNAKVPPYIPAKLPPAPITNKPVPAPVQKDNGITKAPTQAKPAAPAPNPNVSRGGFGVPTNNAPKPAAPAPAPAPKK